VNPTKGMTTLGPGETLPRVTFGSGFMWEYLGISGFVRGGGGFMVYKFLLLFFRGDIREQKKLYGILG